MNAQAELLSLMVAAKRATSELAHAADAFDQAFARFLAASKAKREALRDVLLQAAARELQARDEADVFVELLRRSEEGDSSPELDAGTDRGDDADLLAQADEIIEGSSASEVQ